MDVPLPCRTLRLASLSPGSNNPSSNRLIAALPPPTGAEQAPPEGGVGVGLGVEIVGWEVAVGAREACLAGDVAVEAGVAADLRVGVCGVVGVSVGDGVALGRSVGAGVALVLSVGVGVFVGGAARPLRHQAPRQRGTAMGGRPSVEQAGGEAAEEAHHLV